jgi:hypothetical protein
VLLFSLFRSKIIGTSQTGGPNCLWSRVLLKVPVLKLAREVSYFIEGSITHSQKPAMYPYPEPHQSSPCTNHTSLRLILTYSQLCLGLPSGLFLSRFPTKILYAPHLSRICATYPSHLILFDLITQTILGEQYRSLSSSLRSFLRSPVISSFLGPNSLLNTLFSNTLNQRSSLNVTKFYTH